MKVKGFFTMSVLDCGEGSGVAMEQIIAIATNNPTDQKSALMEECRLQLAKGYMSVVILIGGRSMFSNRPTADLTADWVAWRAGQTVMVDDSDEKQG